MGKRRRQANIRYTHAEVTSTAETQTQQHTGHFDPTAFDFDICCLTYLPLRNPWVCPYGYSFSRDSMVQYLEDHDRHPFIDAVFSIDGLTEAIFTTNCDGDKIDPVTQNALSPRNKIAIIKSTGNCYAYETIVEFNLKADLMIDLLTGQPFVESDIVVIHDLSRARHLPPHPVMSTEVTEFTSEIIRNSRVFVESLSVRSGPGPQFDHLWFLARPTRESLEAALSFREKPLSVNPQVIVSTSIGDITVELDVAFCTMGILNFLGHSLAGHYQKVRIVRIEAGKWFEVSSGAETDETVWGAAISYERDDRRRNYSYPLFLLNHENRQIHITNTATFAIGCIAMDLEETHVIGGVIAGEAIVSGICNESIFPDGRPQRSLFVRNVSVVTNPFPLA
jgi:peptidyl-prolyl cis-trans isomerase-like protein 2